MSETTTTSWEIALTGGIKPGATVRETRMVRVTERGIEFLGDLKWETFSEFVKGWKMLRDETWALGLASLVAYGRSRFGTEKVEALFSQLEFDLADYKRALAIGQIPLELWSNDLTSEHLYVLGMIEDEVLRASWMLACEKHGLDAFRLKKSIEAGKVLSAEELATQRGSGTGFVTIQGLRHDFDRWEQKMGGEQAIFSLSREDKEKLLTELEGPGEVYLKLKAELKK